MFPMNGMGFMGKKEEGLPFIFSVTVGAGQSFTLPTVAAGNYNAKINFGDGGSIKHLTAWNGAERSNTYVSAGTYDITITGVFEGWSVNNYADRLKIVEVKQWGIFSWGTSASGGFFGCANMVISATDMFDTSSVTTFLRTFYNCTSLTTLDVSSWDVGSVTNIAGMFYNCSLINPDTSLWAEMKIIGAELFSANANNYDGEIKLNLINYTGYFKQVFNSSKINKVIIRNGGNIIGTIFSGQPSPFVNCSNLEYLEFGGLKKDLNISWSINMNKTNLLILAASIADMTGEPSPTMTLPNTTDGNDSAVVSAFTNKNWLVSY